MSCSEGALGRDTLEHFEREHEAAYRDMPPVNVLVAGPTGVGKSTLVNAILRRPVARTGKGRPVTEDIEAWSVPGVPVTVYDTPGLELDERSGRASKRIARFVKRAAQGSAVRAPACLLVLRPRAGQPVPGRRGGLHRGGRRSCSRRSSS